MKLEEDHHNDEGEVVIVGKTRRGRMLGLNQFATISTDALNRCDGKEWEIESMEYVSPDETMDRGIERIRITFFDGHEWEFTRYRPTDGKGRLIG